MTTTDDGGSGGFLAAVGSMFTRDFWTFRAINAAFGALLTVGAGVMQLGVGDVMRDEMDRQAAMEREAADAIRRIDEAVAEFKSFEADATLIQVLTLTGTIPAEVRDQVRAIAITNRRHSFRVLLAELHPGDFAAKADEYQRLTEGAIAWDKPSMDGLVEMESDGIRAAHALQETLVARLYDAASERTATAHRLDGYRTLGTSFQMLGLLVVLMGNLVADHLAARRRADPVHEAG